MAAQTFLRLYGQIKNLPLAHGSTQVPVAKNGWCSELHALKLTKPLTAL